jgi:soluble lytic murein transglycosylase
METARWSNLYGQDREKYQQALAALDENNIALFKKLENELADYPLYPYLRYHYLTKNIDRLSDRTVTEFLNQYADTPLGPRLKHRWLRMLATQGQWELYLDQFDNSIQSTELKCYALWAQHKTGRMVASLPSIEDLWLVAHSQPESCNPVFKHWTSLTTVDDEVIWQRFVLAMRNRKSRLARYLIRFMPEDAQVDAQLYRDVYFRPARLKQQAQFLDLTAKRETILIHGMERLAHREPLLAQQLWAEYSQDHHFNERQNQTVARHIILGYAQQGYPDQYQQALKAYPDQLDVDLIEAGIKLSILEQNWAQVTDRINSLPAATQQLNHWQYWNARALQQISDNNDADSIRILTALAAKRDYYGFLAADYLNLPYQTNQQGYAFDGNFLELFKHLPGIIRARELYIVGNQLDARREWQWVSTAFNNDQHYAAAQYAYQLKWYSQAIKSAIDAERWHDLTLRFPLAFESEFTNAAKSQGLDENWLLAVARQESAMMPDAQSNKGARGLMQLMPRTAKEVARKHNIQLRNNSQLLQPETNITIGSTYLRTLYDEFESNVIFATAAYNAGPHRVKKWLGNSNHLPLDIWVEQIPYAETRQYVKNVLAYTVIFALKRSEDNFRMATAPYLDTLSSALAAARPVTINNDLGN